MKVDIARANPVGGLLEPMMHQGRCPIRVCLSKSPAPDQKGDLLWDDQKENAKPTMLRWFWHPTSPASARESQGLHPREGGERTGSNSP